MQNIKKKMQLSRNINAKFVHDDLLLNVFCKIYLRIKRWYFRILQVLRISIYNFNLYI